MNHRALFLVSTVLLALIVMAVFITRREFATEDYKFAGEYIYDETADPGANPNLHGAKFILRSNGTFESGSLKGYWTMADNIVIVEDFKGTAKISIPRAALRAYIQRETGQMLYSVGPDGKLFLLKSSESVGGNPPTFRRMKTSE